MQIARDELDHKKAVEKLKQEETKETETRKKQLRLRENYREGNWGDNKGHLRNESQYEFLNANEISMFFPLRNSMKKFCLTLSSSGNLFCF